MNAITIIGAFAVAIGGLLTAVFGALKFNRGDAGETVAQFKEVLAGMRALLEETQAENERCSRMIVELREEIARLEETVVRLRETIVVMEAAVAGSSDALAARLAGEVSQLEATVAYLRSKLRGIDGR